MRPTQLHIDLSALMGNFAVARDLAFGGSLLCVVKANAYGHGMVPVAQTLAAAGAAMLGVATVAEGAALRAAGIELPILLMGGYLADEAADIVAQMLTPALFCAEQIAPLAAASRAADVPLPVHVKLDTGMGRIGFAVGDGAAAIRQVRAAGLVVDGVFTHFAEADLADADAALMQCDAFAGVYRQLGDLAAAIPHWHAANSAALIRRLALSGVPANLYRPGIMLYGESPSVDFAAPERLRPVARWEARLIQVKTVPAGTGISYGRDFVTCRESRIGTLPVGYADGYPRALSNRGQVLIGGQRVPVVGRVCMDMIMVDLSDLTDEVGIGTPAVLLGEQGGERISAEQLGDVSGTIAYDILCGISERVPRQYAPGIA